MRTDISYEIIDGRELPADQKLGLIGILNTIPGGVTIMTNRDHEGLTFPIVHERDFEDLHEQDMCVLHTKQGDITLQKLTLTNFEDVIPFLEGDPPDFKDDDALNSYFYYACLYQP